MLPLRALPVAFLGVSLLAQTSATAPLPEPGPFFRGVMAAIRQDPGLQEQFSYVEERRDVKVSRLGKVTVGPLRRFEVYPSAEPGGPYRRLIAEDGRPLTARELAEHDAEHRRDLEKEAEERRRESPADRARREARDREQREEREALLTDGIAVYEATLVGREAMGGEPVIKVRLTPRANAGTTTREGAWMKHFSGHAWFSERNHQATLVDMTAFEDVSIGWGIIGRIHQGTRVVISRQRIGSNWLPARFEIDASGRTLLFRTFDIEMVTTYSDYKRLDTSAPPGR